MWGMNQGDTGVVILVMVIGAGLAVMKLITMLQARGKRVTIEVDGRTVIDLVGLSGGEVQAVLRQAGVGQEPTVPRKATADDVR